MNQSILVFTWIFFLVSCSSNELKDTDKNQGSSKSQDQTIEVAPIDAPPEEEENYASQPVMVGGAFLTCQYDGKLMCRLDTDNKTNIEPKSDYVVNVNDQDGLPLSFTQPANLDEWRWVVETRDNTSEIHFEVRTDGETFQYMTYTDLRIMMIGDGPSDLPQGCSQLDPSAEVVPVATPYRKLMAIPGKGVLKIKIGDLCDLIRMNDSYLLLSNGNGEEIEKVFLPARENKDFTITIKIPEAGDYSLDLVSGTRFNTVEDFRVNGIFASFISQTKNK